MTQIGSENTVNDTLLNVVVKEKIMISKNNLLVGWRPFTSIKLLLDLSSLADSYF